MSKTGDTFRALGAGALVAARTIAGPNDDCEERSVTLCQQADPEQLHVHVGEPERAVVGRGPTSEIAPPSLLPPGRSEFGFMPAPSEWRPADMGNESQTPLVMRVAAEGRAV